MSLLLLEALGAMVLLIFIVWWTMFSGRKNGELISNESTENKDNKAEKLEKLEKPETPTQPDNPKPH